MTTSVTDVKVNPDNARQYLNGMTEGVLDSAMAGFSEDATYYGIEKRDGKLFRKLYGPKNGIRAYIGAWLEKATGGISYEIKREVRYGDALLIEWTNVATDEGEEYTNAGMLIFEFDEDGFVKHARAYQDFSPLMKWTFLKD